MILDLFESGFVRVGIHVGYLTNTLDNLLSQLLRGKR